MVLFMMLVFFCKQKTAYEMRISDWSLDVCSSDLNVGDGMNMGLEVGASLDGENLINAVWAVVSTLQREDGYLARYAHLMDMSKPGCIAVNAKGERFGNEASVHFVEAMHKTG